MCPPQLAPVQPYPNEYTYCSPSSIPNGPGACDVNSQCMYAQRLSRYICCGSDSTLKPSRVLEPYSGGVEHILDLCADVCPPSPDKSHTLQPVYGLEGDYRRCHPLAAVGAWRCAGDSACLYINEQVQVRERLNTWNFNSTCS